MKLINNIVLINKTEINHKIETKLLPINYNYLWQKIIKDINEVNAAVNLDNILSSIYLDTPPNSYSIFYNSQKGVSK